MQQQNGSTSGCLPWSLERSSLLKIQDSILLVETAVALIKLPEFLDPITKSITSIFKEPIDSKIDRVVCLVVNMGGCAADEKDPYGCAVEMVARDEEDEDPTRIQIWVRLKVEGKPVMHRLPFTFGPEDFGAGAADV
ncbi:hypothetical protein EV715DRAFT_296934 [Schizophyllum commune]